MSVRTATPADLDVVAALEDECLGVDAWSRGLVEAGLAGEVPTVVYLVAEADGPGSAVVGHAVASIVADIAELQRIAVTPAARRGGHATALLDEVVARSKADGAERLLLEVREDNAGALAFYAARGFVEVDRRRRYYRDGATAVVLRRGLRKGC
ncbi:GNAT family N-acetyltransferase [Nocardioides deserti]|uniref:GNAT family N-acetyltransferase n=1 Tax=Nocardioides deserti TaxID=1588644 RepID=A0ABR6U9K0_9ACTN|nr:N-acetyltransferase [Nocardioides deserti]MBC2961125.1 GNAT family N-acetyltransferase [Nocardioides deserti]GGO76436.1 ribosomal-protein-alanine acetyltransferase [Nocardioides deserti]